MLRKYPIIISSLWHCWYFLCNSGHQVPILEHLGGASLILQPQDTSQPH